MKKIAVIGSTGSIGTQTLEIVRNNKDIEVCSLAAGHNIDLLERQIREFKPEIACVYDSEKAAQLKKRVADTDVEICSGMSGLVETAVVEAADIVVLAVVGMVGIRPAIAAINAHKDLALANKETLVTAGHIIMTLAGEKNVRVLPVDSEHSAIFQCLNGEDTRAVSKLILTASGGPFRGMTRERMKDVRPEDALKHPNWTMGRKISIDSATMVNKGLEIIEAKWLFDMDIADIDVVVQPQSLIHSMVQFDDGAVIAQLGTPDMKLPIQYALYYPERKYLEGERLDFSRIAHIDFEIPDINNFRGLGLAIEAGKEGGSMPTVMNAANEKAVALFLDKKIGFLDIIDIIEKSMSHHRVIKNPSLEDILETEQETYEYIDSLAGNA